ncbi:MAG TPA: TonB-dependent receptor [Flavisolibacter sp.]|jgi:hemoglobin/transferrin/lactoferrin receptor protein|nr:TonB-dependent receptor [Flavisolibacter sp.]
MKRLVSLGFVLGCTLMSAGQDTLSERQLETITLSVNKWQQSRNEVPNKITRVIPQQIYHYNPQTAADMLAQTGTVFVQKSQLGGGSPMIRGFATNRVLLVVDGVRMNNAIYRSGNLQNVISIDPLTVQNTEIIFGPGSLIYGSDAIGGVMSFRTLQPQFANDSKRLAKGTAFVRYATGNNEKTAHADVTAGSERLFFLAAYTRSDYDDLRMGRNGRTENYMRPEYVERVAGQDVIIQNQNPNVQRFSGYTQDNFLGKIRFKAKDALELQYAFTYAGTGDAPRYDRLIQYRNGALRFAEWKYGPMLWRMHTFSALLTQKSVFADNISIVAAYQNNEESRIDRARGSNTRTSQSEEVDAYSLNVDATKQFGRSQIFYGLETVFNKVGSFGYQTNIANGVSAAFATRYPNGSTWSTTGIYGSYKYNLSSYTTLTGGLRYSFNTLNARFDTTFIPFPYKKTALSDGAVTGSLGITYRPDKTWQINGNFSTGYRMPNVDDIGKLFESTQGNITVPNPGLQPEYAVNFEAGIVKDVLHKLRLEANVFHTILTDAVVRRPFLFNGADSIEFSGVRSRVEALQNVAKATVWGIQGSLRFHLSNNLYLQTHANWIWGEETDDAKNEQVPLRHAPPFYGSTHLHYRKNKLHAELYSFYNSEVTYENLAPTEKAKPDIYAKDDQGRPFSPAWYTLNAKLSYQIFKSLFVAAGWENITDQRYRPYSSGIVAAGSNLIVSLKTSF